MSEQLTPAEQAWVDQQVAAAPPLQQWQVDKVARVVAGWREKAAAA